jgi:hypothetical protein
VKYDDKEHEIFESWKTRFNIYQLDLTHLDFENKCIRVRQMSKE